MNYFHWMIQVFMFSIYKKKCFSDTLKVFKYLRLICWSIQGRCCCWELSGCVTLSTRYSQDTFTESCWFLEIWRIPWNILWFAVCYYWCCSYRYILSLIIDLLKFHACHMFMLSPFSCREWCQYKSILLLK